MPYVDMQEQLKERKTTADSFVYGICRFSYGLAKKVLIADILGKTADSIFSCVQARNADIGSAWLGIICYTLQIYFDFAGYSDMAVGVGKMFGFDFMENFNYPYLSKSITEFWRRWHISLSSWFRNYLYIPLGGNRTGNVYFNLFVVFLITGIWHGANWTFVAWGLWNGFFVISERIVRDKPWYKRIPSPLKLTATLFIIMMGWVLFRVSSVTDAVYYYNLLFGFAKPAQVEFTWVYYLNRQIVFTVIVAILLSAPWIERLSAKFKDRPAFSVCRVVFVNALLVLGVIFTVNSTYSPFIYFQF